MTELKLEVGKTYNKRGGGQVKINQKVFRTLYPFKGEDGDSTRSFLPNGRWSCESKNDLDLISEYIEPAQLAARTPLVHAEQRIDHANGWDIEGLDPDYPGDTWTYVQNPEWHPGVYYRRKPEPAPLKPNIIKLVEVTDDGLGLSTSHLKTLMDHGCKKALRIEFNPNDQTLVSAEVVTL